MSELNELIASEIADFFAGFGGPGEPDIQSGEAQRLLTERVLSVLALRERAEPEKRIAELTEEIRLMFDAMHAAVALTSAGCRLNNYDECVMRLHEWGALPDYCIAIYLDYIYGLISEDRLLDFGWINDNGAFSAAQAETRIAELEAYIETLSKSAPTKPDKRLAELTMWVKRLAWLLRRSRPNSALPNDAMDYLRAKGLISAEDVLR
ncbi:hypothetical protein [Cronobacter turicensis]|uniref:hypothetical protein n=1 Tax=Cronobacter turicensis TaxID=413502 RepID=UPI0024C434CF|nr:hypothetical protein [Cronobacter turicensis]MDK1208244.1 hypothetical protein [Cronobacter turicensis]MDK1216829.1 hypothetical protein [Cronobacter turicensis]MDK1233838.1 hypothetical protein [Cronobacter turicensis]HDI3035749.1 hypothetical protein [Cronobacter turicensis]